MRDMNEVMELFVTENNLERVEGRKGLENLCKIVNTLGYKDKQYFGQLPNSCSIGDLVEFLEDNSGCIEAIINWICDIGGNATDWQEKLEAELSEDEGDDDDEEED